MKQYFLSIYTFFTTPKSSVTTCKYTQKENEDYNTEIQQGLVIQKRIKNT